MAMFRLDIGEVLEFDTHLAQLGRARLCRCPEGVTIECDDAGRAVTVLARAGANAKMCDSSPSPAVGARPAIARDLTPLAFAGMLDVVAVRSVDMAEATRRLRGSPSWWPSRRTDRVAIRALLRSEDRLLAWRRVVWGSVAILRSPGLDRLRPIVFDRASADHGPERFSLASAGELTRWLTG